MPDRKKLPIFIRRKTEKESFGFCSLPKCFNVGSQIHHIDGTNSNDDPNNLIHLCGHCHDSFTYKRTLTRDDFIDAKNKLEEFTPDRSHSLYEIMDFLFLLYNEGRFGELEKAVCVLLKFNERIRGLGPNILAVLFEYLSESDIQTEEKCSTIHIALQARNLFLSRKDYSKSIHVDGLIALQFSSFNDYEAAEFFLKRSQRDSQALSDDVKFVNLGWTNNLLSDISLKKRDFFCARKYADSSFKYYHRVTGLLNVREQADMAMQTAKIIIDQGMRSNLPEAENLLNSCKNMIDKSGWTTKKIRWLTLNFFRFIISNDLREAKEALTLAWIINKKNGGPKTVSLLKIVTDYPDLCPKEIIADLLEEHGDCAMCDKNHIESIAACSISRKNNNNALSK
ncbi:MAG: HNH endonuclease [Magnetococcus sp. DMHC-1]